MANGDLPKEPPSSEITPEQDYKNRRDWLKNAGIVTAGAAIIGGGLVLLTGKGKPKTPSIGGTDKPPVLDKSMPPPPADPKPVTPETPVVAAPKEEPLAVALDADPFKGPFEPKKEFTVAEAKTKYDAVTTYNNFYELGTDKSDPAENEALLKPHPWSVAIEGEVGKPQTIDIDKLLRWFPLEERVYRMRCVEAWSMVIPWLGFPLADLIKRVAPTSKAKFVAFETIYDQEMLPHQRRRTLQWPYVEGLTIDEAMHPLTLMAVGLYGKKLPNQNGAPLRLVLPWKYGFKNIKSIVKIRFTEKQPPTTWSMFAPNEYGFYANVNPEVDHPRWTQKTERRIGELLRRPTLKFNGYGEQVAHLYKDLDLNTNY